MNNSLSDTQKDVIRAFADNNTNTLQTAKAMFFSASSVRYHLIQIRKKTGLEPRSFHDLVKLLEVCHG